MNTHDIDLPDFPPCFEVLTDRTHTEIRAYARAAIEADRKRKGEVVVTTDEAGNIVAVTRQDDEGRILSVIAAADSKRNAYQCPVCGSTSTQAHLQCLDCDAESVDSELAKHNKNAFVDRKRRGEPVAWLHEDDPARVMSAVRMATITRDGAESALAVRAYSIPLYAAPQPAENSVNLEVAIQAISAMHSNDTDWDTSYWNQAVGRCVSELNKLRSQQPAEPVKVPSDAEIFELAHDFSGMTFEDLDVVGFGRALLERYGKGTT